VVAVHPAAPGPGFTWVDGYWYPVGGHYRWHEGYWTRPPYEGLTDGIATMTATFIMTIAGNVG
jgi:hypothetical protein